MLSGTSDRWVHAVVLVSLAFLLTTAGCTFGPVDDDTGPTSTPTPDSWNGHDSYETTTVTAVDGETGAELGAVTAAIADNASLRYTGLSETDAMPTDRGMLFVYSSPRDLTYVMRNMSFGLDIVFVAENRTITAIHHAPAPGSGEDGESQRYSGHGQYVLEVNRNWTTDHGVEAGDRLEFELAA